HSIIFEDLKSTSRKFLTNLHPTHPAKNNTMKKEINFDVNTIPLSGSNLIEASAGTGKTYSIALLVLRLIIWKKASIEEILMVTFTKAAVAELDGRIRLFVRSAYRYSSENEAIED